MSTATVTPAVGLPAVSVYKFHDKEVRTFINGNEIIWFVAGDIATALDYRDAHNLIRILDDDEKGTHIVSTQSGAQEMAVVNESGMYHAIIKSRKPEAIPFRKWVTSEVLPAIRRTGCYTAPAPGSLRAPDAPTLSIHFPKETILPKKRELPHQAWLTPRVLLNPENNQPIRDILKILTAAGYDVEGARWEYEGLRFALERLCSLMDSIADDIHESRHMGRNVYVSHKE